jgi:hypothetical protein
VSTTEIEQAERRLDRALGALENQGEKSR